MPNPQCSTVTPEEENRARYELWRRFDKYAPACLKVQTMEGSLVPLELNEIQTLLQEIIADIRRQDRLIRLVILKARREGISTWTAGRFYWRVSSNANKYAMMITHEPEASDFLFSMQKRFNVHMTPEFKPEEKYNNKKVLEFNNDNGTGLDSALRVGTAGKEDLGSGMKIDYFHASELAKWDRNVATALLTSILQTIPKEPHTEIIMESTAKGIGGEFYDRYWNSRYRYDIYLDGDVAKYKLTINEKASPNNMFNAIFIPWFVFKKYQEDVPEDFILTEDEKEMKALYGISDRHLQWRRVCIENNCNGSVDIFKQEYPSNALEAFLASGMSVFTPTEKVLLAKENAPEPIQKYDIQIGMKQIVAKKDGKLLVWEEPVANRKYIIGADVAEGLEKGDYSCLDVIDHLTGNQVAHWWGKIPPDQFATILMVVGRRYNNALLVPERNNHGLIVVTTLLDEGYPNIYVETVHEPPQKPRKRYGWVTTKAKHLITDNLASEFREGTSGIKHKETFDEMLTFKQEGKELEAEVGKHDDRVMSIAISKYVRTKLPLPNMLKIREMNKQQYKINTKKHTPPPTSSWT
jgi:hypothetical protein